jgi:hypothetical protein
MCCSQLLSPNNNTIVPVNVPPLVEVNASSRSRAIYPAHNSCTFWCFGHFTTILNMDGSLAGKATTECLLQEATSCLCFNTIAIKETDLHRSIRALLKLVLRTENPTYCMSQAVQNRITKQW